MSLLTEIPTLADCLPWAVLSESAEMIGGHDWRIRMWDEVRAGGELQRELERERERYALARLLQARGEDIAAAIVAVSAYDDVCVDNWNGGQFEAVLAVPPELYDQACEEGADALDKACRNLIGDDRYRGLNITLRLTPIDSEWMARIMEAPNAQWVQSERLDKPGIRM